MLPLDVKRLLVLVVKILVFYGLFCSGGDGDQKIVMVINVKNPQCQIISGFTCQVGGNKNCLGVNKNNPPADCCYKDDVNFSTVMSSGKSICSFTLNNKTIVVMTQHDECMPSQGCSFADCLLNLDCCLNKGGMDISQACLYNSTYDASSCKDDYNVTISSNGTVQCISCKLPQITLQSTGPAGPTQAANVMKTLSSLLGTYTTAAIKTPDIKGFITKLLLTNPTSINIGFTRSGDVTILGDNDVGSGLSTLVHIPVEASSKAVKMAVNGSIAGVLQFTGIYQDDPNSFFLNNEMVGIDLGAKISNLSQTINIQFNNVSKNGKIASCRSWNGTGEKPSWVTDGCKTVEINDSISCQCTHLTFFAILMSPPPTNMSASDFKSLTYITSIGCGLSMVFLAVGLFMHFLIRKGKASQATKILMNLFIAMFILNLSFLINESLANLGISWLCVATAAVMHYTMLATFSWFFIQALHMYQNLWRLPAKIKHYMIMIYIVGWATPAVVVITLLALNKYDYLDIQTNDGGSTKMCWIFDPLIHQGVNIGYYSIVFIFTFGVFILTVQQIIRFKPTAGKPKDNSSIKRNTLSILGLFLLLGITWAFAFFSYGPLLLPSYYIFTILNSFQGFFLFIYYYHSSKIVGEDKGLRVNHSSTTTLTQL